MKSELLGFVPAARNGYPGKLSWCLVEGDHEVLLFWARRSLTPRYPSNFEATSLIRRLHIRSCRMKEPRLTRRYKLALVELFYSGRLSWARLEWISVVCVLLLFEVRILTQCVVTLPHLENSLTWLIE